MNNLTSIEILGRHCEMTEAFGDRLHSLTDRMLVTAAPR